MKVRWWMRLLILAGILRGQHMTEALVSNLLIKKGVIY